MSTGIERVGVVGGGIMGTGIAEVCARAGLPVTLVEVSPERAEAARGRIEASVAKAVRRGVLTAADAADAL